MGDKIYAFVFATILTLLFLWDSQRNAKFASFRQDGDKVYSSVAFAEYGRTEIFLPECGTGTAVPVGALSAADGSATQSLFFPNENSASGVTSYASWHSSVDPAACQGALKAYSGSFSKLAIRPNGLFLGSSTGSVYMGATYVDSGGTIR